MTADAVIVTDGDDTLDKASLPEAGPVASYIDVRHVEVSQTHESGALRTIIHIEYQSFFDPEEAARTDVPGYEIDFLQGGARIPAHVPGWSFGASPFRHDLNPIIDPALLRPDHAFLMAPPGSAKLRLVASVIVALSAALLLARSRGWIFGFSLSTRPFASASRVVARLAGTKDADAASETAMLALHRAFDATDARRVMGDDLERFLERHPQFSRMRAEIAAFFAASRVAFYGDDGSRPALRDLSTLGRHLARAERAG